MPCSLAHDGHEKLNGKTKVPVRHQNGSGWTTSSARPAKSAPVAFRQTLAPDQSALKRDLILSDLETVDSRDAAALWAQRIMAAKNSLTAADAARVEAAFHTKLTTLHSEKGGNRLCRLQLKFCFPKWAEMRQPGCP